MTQEEKKLTDPAQTEETPKAKRTGKEILNTVVNVVLVLAIILAALCTYTSFVSTSGNGVPSILGVRVFSIQTESMYPTLLPGDLIFGTGVKDAAELERGDIITYWTVINGERVLNTHRIYEIYDGGGYLIFETKGDKNTAVDALTVHESEIVAQYADIRVEGLGKAFDYLQTSTGFLIVVVVPVFLFFLFHLVQFFRVLFEYQNVKNRIKYEQERGRTEDLIAEQQRKADDEKKAAREAMEAELRERLKAELLASMAASKQPEEEPKEEPEEKTEEVTEEKTEEAAEEEPKEEPKEETKETPEAETEEVPKAEEKEEKPAVDEAAIEAMIAKQRAAIEAELRAKIMAEMMAKAEKNEESAEEAVQN